MKINLRVLSKTVGWLCAVCKLDFLVVVPKELRVNKLLQHYHLEVVSLSSKNDAYHGTENVVEGGMLVNG